MNEIILFVILFMGVIWLNSDILNNPLEKEIS